MLFVFSGEEKAAGEQRGCNSGTHEQGETLPWKLGCTSRWGLHSINHVNCFLPSPSPRVWSGPSTFPLQPNWSRCRYCVLCTVWHNKPPWLVHTLRLSGDSEERFRAHTWGQSINEITSVLYKSDLCFDFSHIQLKSLQVPFTSPQHVFTLVFYGIQVLQCVPLHAQSALVKKYICNCLYWIEP